MEKNIWRRLRRLLTALGILCIGIQGCGNHFSYQNVKHHEEKSLSIVATIYPEYDWVMEILGEKAGEAEVTLLMGEGSDLHSFQPAPRDIVTISTCDIFIYVGGESDRWVADVLRDAKNQDMKVICLMDILGDRVKDEDIIEGMQEETHEGHGAEQEDGHEGEGEEKTERDEHVWLSVKNAITLCEKIGEAIGNADSGNREIYRENTDRYIGELRALDERYERAVGESRKRPLIFCDRFPFKYLMEDYGLRYYAAFPGCSTETEAGFETVAFLSQKADELQVPCLIGLEGRNHRIPETVADNMTKKNRDILQMNSMQSVTREDVQEGLTYLSVMEDNLKVMEKALE